MTSPRVGGIGNTLKQPAATGESGLRPVGSSAFKRLRAYLPALEKSLNQLVIACGNPENGDRSYRKWLEDLAAALKLGGEKAPRYPMNGKQLQSAEKTLAALAAIRALWQPTKAEENAPRPRPVLRPRAQI